MTRQPTSATIGFASSLYKPQKYYCQSHWRRDTLDCPLAMVVTTDQVISVRYAVAITSPAAESRNVTFLVAFSSLLRAFEIK